jgi:hypothetical protein
MLPTLHGTALDHTIPTLPSVRGKRVVLISHDLSQTGSPLFLVETVDKIQEYDPKEDCWSQLECLPVARKGGVIWEHDATLYFCGGQDESKEVLSETMAARITRPGTGGGSV